VNVHHGADVPGGEFFARQISLQHYAIVFLD
jgi:hypothetical protein